MEPAKERLTIKQSRNSQPSSLQLPKGPEIRPRSKGDSEHTESKVTVVHIKGGPRPEDEAMAQGLQKPPATSNQNKSSNSKNIKIETCYRYHKRGQFSVNCTSRKLLGCTSLELKPEPSKTSDSLVPLELSNSGFMHLSFPKSFDPGIKQGDGFPNHAERLKESQGQHLTRPQNVEEDARNNKSAQAAKDQIILQLAETIWVNLKFTCLNFTCPNYKISKTDIIHLFSAKSVEFISGTEAKDHMDDPHKITRCLHAKRKQEVVISNLLIPDVPEDKTPSSRVPDQNRGVVLLFLLKGEPPDVPSKIKPIKYQGKALESQKRMKPDLLYISAGNPVSRSKPFQERGDDIYTETTLEPWDN